MGNSVFRFFWTCNVIFRGCKFRTSGLKLSAKSDPVYDGQEGVACSSKVYAGRAVRADLAGWCIPVCRKWLQLNNHGGLAVVWQKWQLPEITTSALFSCIEVWTPLLRRADKAFHRGCKALFVPCVLSQEAAVLQAAWEACSSSPEPWAPERRSLTETASAVQQAAVIMYQLHRKDKRRVSVLWY